MQIFPSTTVDVRAVQERSSKLLKMYRSQSLRTGRRSGTEEQYGRLEVLLADIDAESCAVKPKSADRKKIQNNKALQDIQASKVVKALGEGGKNALEDTTEVELLRDASDNEGNILLFQFKLTEYRYFVSRKRQRCWRS